MIDAVGLVLAGAMAAAPAIDCDEQLTQFEMTQCARREYEAADALLNEQYRKSMAAMRALDEDPYSHLSGDTRPGYADALRAAQRAWIAFRDAHCLSMGYQMRGGSAEPMVVWGCMETLTRERIEQLIDVAAR